jgi:hypothetical protein
LQRWVSDITHFCHFTLHFRVRNPEILETIESERIFVEIFRIFLLSYRTVNILFAGFLRNMRKVSILNSFISPIHEKTTLIEVPGTEF